MMSHPLLVEVTNLLYLVVKSLQVSWNDELAMNSVSMSQYHAEKKPEYETESGSSILETTCQYMPRALYDR
jgi:hypothetical protein